MTDFGVTVEGMDALARRINDFQLYLGKSLQDAVRKAAYEASRSLIARTKPTARKSYHGPEIVLATRADTDALAERIPMPPNWKHSPENWRHYIQALADKGYGAKSDRPKDNGYRYLKIWRKDKASKAQLKNFWAYRNSGLAKLSWRWCANKTKGGKAAAKYNDARQEGYVTNNCSVRPAENGLAIIITNRLGYIREALASPSAITDALRAAAQSMKGQIERKIGQKIP